MDDFFVGYNWPQSPGLLRAARRAALGIGIGVVSLAGALATGHVSLQGGLFEFGRVKTVSGTIVETPVPMLRPADGSSPWPLLVARGKHGAEAVVRGLDGRTVEVDVTRIARGDRTMFEIASTPVLRAASPSADAGSSASVQDSDRHVSTERKRVTLRGEIVDSKCFLGVMVPGSGTTHRDCASLCLRGGIPPALFVQEADGTSSLLLLVGPQPRLAERATLLAGQPIEVTGTLERQGGWKTLTSNPDGWRWVEH